MLKVVGVLLIFSAIATTAWWVMTEKPHKGWSFSLGLLAVFAGMFLVLEGRVTELTVNGIGTIKSAAEQASADASAISGLKERVEAQSATVELVAKDAADVKLLVSDLTLKNHAAEEKLSRLNKSMQEGERAVKKLQDYIQFNSTVIAAQTDSRKAYDQLRVWGKDSSFPFQESAEQAADAVLDQHAPAIVKGGFNVPWTEDTDPMKLTLPQLWQDFKRGPSYIRVAILEFLWTKRTDISKKDRLQFLADVLSSDESLNVVEYAGRYFEQGTGDKLKPLAIVQHLEWWKENKDSID